MSDESRGTALTVEPAGIEPASVPCKGTVLPLNEGPEWRRYSSGLGGDAPSAARGLAGLEFAGRFSGFFGKSAYFEGDSQDVRVFGERETGVAGDGANPWGDSQVFW